VRWFKTAGRHLIYETDDGRFLCVVRYQIRNAHVKNNMNTKMSCKDHPDLAVYTAAEYVSHFNMYHDQTTGASNGPVPEPFEAPAPTDADHILTTQLGEFPL
jgi:hypothetical protein